VRGRRSVEEETSAHTTRAESTKQTQTAPDQEWFRLTIDARGQMVGKFFASDGVSAGPEHEADSISPHRVRDGGDVLHSPFAFALGHVLPVVLLMRRSSGRSLIDSNSSSPLWPPMDVVCGRNPLRLKKDAAPSVAAQYVPWILHTTLAHISSFAVGEPGTIKSELIRSDISQCSRSGRSSVSHGLRSRAGERRAADEAANDQVPHMSGHRVTHRRSTSPRDSLASWMFVVGRSICVLMWLRGFGVIIRTPPSLSIVVVVVVIVCAQFVSCRVRVRVSERTQDQRGLCLLANM
jgi:hypothetical protein